MRGPAPDIRDRFDGPIATNAEVHDGPTEIAGFSEHHFGVKLETLHRCKVVTLEQYSSSDASRVQPSVQSHTQTVTIHFCSILSCSSLTIRNILQSG